jgi:hypothetical protein
MDVGRQEIEELRESMNEIRLSRAHAGGTGVGLDAKLQREKNAVTSDALLVSKPRDIIHEGRFGSEGGISLVENPVHTLINFSIYVTRFVFLQIFYFFATCPNFVVSFYIAFGIGFLFI